jgi:hypothetical protein
MGFSWLRLPPAYGTLSIVVAGVVVYALSRTEGDTSAAD